MKATFKLYQKKYYMYHVQLNSYAMTTDYIM